MEKNKLDKMKGIMRELRLEQEAMNGRPRTKTWGGKKTIKQDRHNAKRELRNLF